MKNVVVIHVFLCAKDIAPYGHFEDIYLSVIYGCLDLNIAQGTGI